MAKLDTLIKKAKADIDGQAPFCLSPSDWEQAVLATVDGIHEEEDLSDKRYDKLLEAVREYAREEHGSTY